MPTFDLYTIAGTRRLDRFEAGNLGETITLVRIRLEYQDVEGWQNDDPAAVVPMVGVPILTRQHAPANDNTATVT